MKTTAYPNFIFFLSRVNFLLHLSFVYNFISSSFPIVTLMLSTQQYFMRIREGMKKEHSIVFYAHTRRNEEIFFPFFHVCFFSLSSNVGASVVYSACEDGISCCRYLLHAPVRLSSYVAKEGNNFGAIIALLLLLFLSAYCPLVSSFI